MDVYDILQVEQMKMEKEGISLRELSDMILGKLM